MNEPLIDRRTETWLILILLAVQFTHIMDFVVLMPLGPKLMRDFHINTSQFGFLVSAYTISAAVSGILSSLFLDRINRKNALIGLYAGFGISTLLCALSGAYWPFLISRMLAGAFGGILSALTLSIIGDYIPIERRGRATGLVLSAFSLASVIGVPSGLWLANQYDWHAPFFLLACTCIPIILIAGRQLPTMDYHLVQTVQLNALPRIKEVLNTPGARMAFLLMAIMMLAGFSVIPYISPYLVFNCGVSEDSLFLVYLIGGIFTFLASNVSGRLSDKLSPFKVFVWVTPLSVIPILMVTMLPAWPLSWILIVTTLFMALLSGRLIPIISLMTRTVEPNLRGTFMSLLASIQQSSAGVAAWIAGMMVTETPAGKLENYDRVGWMATGFSLFAIFITWKLIPLLKIGGQPAASPETIPSPNNHQSEDALHTIKVSEEQPQ